MSTLDWVLPVGATGWLVLDGSSRGDVGGTPSSTSQPVAPTSEGNAPSRAAYNIVECRVVWIRSHFEIKF